MRQGAPSNNELGATSRIVTSSTAQGTEKGANPKLSARAPPQSCMLPPLSTDRSSLAMGSISSSWTRRLHAPPWTLRSIHTSHTPTRPTPCTTGRWVSKLDLAASWGLGVVVGP